MYWSIPHYQQLQMENCSVWSPEDLPNKTVGESCPMHSLLQPSKHLWWCPFWCLLWKLWVDVSRLGWWRLFWPTQSCLFGQGIPKRWAKLGGCNGLIPHRHSVLCTGSMGEFWSEPLRFGHYLFYLNQTEMTHNEARGYCQARGGDQITLHDKETSDTVRAVLTQRKCFPEEQITIESLQC